MRQRVSRCSRGILSVPHFFYRQGHPGIDLQLIATNFANVLGGYYDRSLPVLWTSTQDEYWSPMLLFR